MSEQDFHIWNVNRASPRESASRTLNTSILGLGTTRGVSKEGTGAIPPPPEGKNKRRFISKNKKVKKMIGPG